MNIVLLLSILLSLASCKTDTKSSNNKNKTNKSKVITTDDPPAPTPPLMQKTLLDSIREKMHSAYQSHPDIGNEITEIPTSVIPSECTPCDMEFLVYLSKKDDYDMQDIKTLLCLDDNDVCDDNAEFVPFYNEIIFKVFDRERRDLSISQIDSLLRDHELVEELENPMSETNSKSLITLLKNKN